MASKNNKYWVAALGLGLYIFLGYFVERSDSFTLILSYSFLFLIYLWSWLKSETAFDYRFWILAAVAFRCSLLFSTPQLSDDFYRYIWDGRMWIHGINAFSLIPSEVVKFGIPGLDLELFDQLNSKEYITVYPTLAQFVFWLSVTVSQESIMGSVIVIRGLVLLSEIGTLILMQKLLKSFEIRKSNLLIYALNPLVILEFTGNLHFEVFVVFFLMLTIYFINKTKWNSAALSFSLAVATKLLPLILLPSLIQKFKWKKSLQFYFVVFISLIVLFVWVVNWALMEGAMSSIQLYFQKFEFNASIYYLVREYGFYTKGFNIIQTTGWKLGLAATMSILIISFWPRKNQIDPLMSWMQTMTWVYGVYFLFATTVHPWYIIPMIAVSVFTSYRFVVLWSFLIFFTYLGYEETGFLENLWIVSLEYIFVFAFLIYELVKFNINKQVSIELAE